MKRIIAILFFAVLAMRPFSCCSCAQEYRYSETWVQLAPAVLDIALPSEESFAQRLTGMALAYGISSTVVFTLKSVVDEVRPDGSRNNSFPSGHTSMAFTGAELLRQDKGFGWGAVGYACGVYTGAMRVVHQRHWWWDTCAGAAIGVGSALLARALTPVVMEELVEPVLSSFGVSARKPESRAYYSVTPAFDMVSGAGMARFSIRF